MFFQKLLFLLEILELKHAGKFVKGNGNRKIQIKLKEI